MSNCSALSPALKCEANDRLRTLKSFWRLLNPVEHVFVAWQRDGAPGAAGGADMNHVARTNLFRARDEPVAFPPSDDAVAALQDSLRIGPVQALAQSLKLEAAAPGAGFLSD